jgi:hypothetical protein
MKYFIETKTCVRWQYGIAYFHPEPLVLLHRERGTFCLTIGKLAVFF